MRYLEIARAAAWAQDNESLGRRWVKAFAAVHTAIGQTTWGGIVLPHTIELHKLTI